jgi:group I intron endonuclease
MAICKSILKYGHGNFKLDILEYCSQDVLLKREQYYIDLLKPEYNILSIAGSTLGYKHREETLEKFKTREFTTEMRLNLKKAATGRILSEDTKKKLSLIKKGNKLSEKNTS